MKQYPELTMCSTAFPRALQDNPSKTTTGPVALTALASKAALLYLAARAAVATGEHVPLSMIALCQDIEDILVKGEGLIPAHSDKESS